VERHPPPTSIACWELLDARGPWRLPPDLQGGDSSANLRAMFEGFTRHRIETSQSTTINLLTAGTGEGLLLLHGCPETLVMWHEIAPAFADDFAVVASDLRGYGDSSKPRGASDHGTYSFRAMARDQVEVMKVLGHDRFVVVGHDRGARVVHRMALDHPGAVRKAAVLDILPTLTLYEETDAHFARAYWEWFFFIQGYDFPETLIGAAPEKFLRYELGPLVDGGVIAQKRGTSICAESAIAPRSMRCARTIERARRSIWSTTAATSTGRSPAPCSSSGAGRTRSGSASTCSTLGGNGRCLCAAYVAVCSLAAS
jgi:pimeloyl-ACP methyl ester carboxylesterase